MNQLLFLPKDKLEVYEFSITQRAQTKVIFQINNEMNF